MRLNHYQTDCQLEFVEYAFCDHHTVRLSILKSNFYQFSHTDHIFVLRKVFLSMTIFCHPSNQSNSECNVFSWAQATRISSRTLCLYDPVRCTALYICCLRAQRHKTPWQSVIFAFNKGENNFRILLLPKKSTYFNTWIFFCQHESRSTGKFHCTWPHTLYRSADDTASPTISAQSYR